MLNLKEQIKQNKTAFAIYTVLRLLTLLTLVSSVITRNKEGVVFSALALILFLVPAFVEKSFKIRIPELFQGFIFIFIFCAEVLGEIGGYYIKFPWWDTMLHTANGFLAAAIGFSLVNLLNDNSKYINLSPFYLAFVAFCFSMTIGVLWEFYECYLDLFFLNDMQNDFIVRQFASVKLDPEHYGKLITLKDITKTVITANGGQEYIIPNGYLDIGILDTMKDLFVNFIGAVVYCTFGYIYAKTHSATSLSDALMVQKVSK